MTNLILDNEHLNFINKICLEYKHNPDIGTNKLLIHHDNENVLGLEFEYHGKYFSNFGNKHKEHITTLYEKKTYLCDGFNISMIKEFLDKKSLNIDFSTKYISKPKIFLYSKLLYILDIKKIVEKKNYLLKQIIKIESQFKSFIHYEHSNIHFSISIKEMRQVLRYIEEEEFNISIGVVDKYVIEFARHISNGVFLIHDKFNYIYFEGMAIKSN